MCPGKTPTVHSQKVNEHMFNSYPMILALSVTFGVCETTLELPSEVELASFGGEVALGFMEDCIAIVVVIFPVLPVAAVDTSGETESTLPVPNGVEASVVIVPATRWHFPNKETCPCD